MTRVVLLGPPGAGKGTQAARLSAALGVPHLSTGDELRSAIASGSDFGRRMKAILDAGKLVPDEVMEGFVASLLRAPRCRGGFLLDGYPRTVPQAFFLAGVMAGSDAAIDHAVLIDVPREELVARMLKRARGPDDTPEVIARRIDDYAAKTAPLVGFYEGRGLLRRTDGTGTPDAVYARLADSVGAPRP